MRQHFILIASMVALFLVLTARQAQAVPAIPKIDSLVMSATQPAAVNSNVIWYDNFDIDRSNSYFGSNLLYTTIAFGNGKSMECYYPAGEMGNGGCQLAFGDNPLTNNRVRSGQKFTDIYWRIYVKYPSNWVGVASDQAAAKLSRAIQFAGSNWSEASILHCWAGGTNGTSETLDPASGVKNNVLVTTTYNDFAHLRWLGNSPASSLKLASTSEAGRWVCIECRMKLNSTSSTGTTNDGYGAMWIDGTLATERKNMNFRGTWDTYGINAVFLEAYWNEKAPVNEYRYIDDFVVSTQPIGPVTVPANPTMFKTPLTASTCTAWQVIIASDSLGANVVWTSNTLPGNNNQLDVNESTGVFSGAAAGKTSLQAGPMYFCKVRQQDSTGWSAWSYWHQPFMVEAPLASNDSYVAYAGYTLTVAAPGVLSNDTGAGALTAAKVSDPSHGSLSLSSDGSFTYTPSAGYVGSDSFTYKVHTTAGDGNTATVVITVMTPVPLAVDDSYAASVGQPLTVAAAAGLLTNDTGPGALPLTAVKASDPSHGSLLLNADGSFTYTPTPGYVGSDSFTYKARNINGDSNTATVYINVATITLTGPNGGEMWSIGATGTAVTWTSVGTIGNVDIDLSADGGATWSSLAANVPNNGYRCITVPDCFSKLCLVRVRQTGIGSPSDVSDADFTIALPGDVTLNGFVDGGDLNALLANWNKTDATWADGDFTGNGCVDGDDLNLLLMNWNVHATPAAPGTADNSTTGDIGSSSSDGSTVSSVSAAAQGKTVYQTTVASADATPNAQADATVTANANAATFTAQVNFQPASVVSPQGYLVDSGLPFSAVANGYTYGWTKDLSAGAIQRNNAASPDIRYDTAIRLANGGTWEMAVPNGMYNVKIVAGDGGAMAIQKFSVEGVPATQTTASIGWSEETVAVVVTDGRLTITASPGSSICFVQITGK